MKAEIVKRRGGWFVTGEEWSGPWSSVEAAELARDGEYELAHQLERQNRKAPLRVRVASGDTND